MESRELRLGSLVLSEDGEIIEVFHLDTDNDGNSRINYLDSQHYEPIPLTEEILLKAGFVLQNKNANAYQHKGTTRYGYLTDGVFTFAGIWGEYLSVHELQNIYFALYKEELKIENL